MSTNRALLMDVLTGITVMVGGFFALGLALAALCFPVIMMVRFVGWLFS